MLKPRVNTNLFLNFYSNRVIHRWNSLPSKVVQATSINCFKNHLDHHFKDFKYATYFNAVGNNGWFKRPFNLTFSRQFLLLRAPLQKEARAITAPSANLLCYANNLNFTCFKFHEKRNRILANVFTNTVFCFNVFMLLMIMINIFLHEWMFNGFYFKVR